MWWKVQCEARTNPKFATAGPVASWVWFCANSWAREHLTDGHVPKAMLASLVPGLSVTQVKRAAQALVEARLAHATEDGGFTIHDFLAHHPSKEKVKADREADSDRKRPKNESDSSRKDGQFRGVSESPRTRAGDSPSSIAPDLREEEAPKTQTIQRVQGIGAFGAGSLPRDHMRHAVCGPGYRICLKDWEFAELVRHYGAAESEARPAIEAFIAKLTEALGPNQSPGGFKQIERDFEAHLKATGRVASGPRLSSDAPAGDDRHEQKLRDIAAGRYGSSRG